MARLGRTARRSVRDLRSLGLGALGLCLATACPASALDLTITFAVKGDQGGSTLTHYVSATHLRLSHGRQDTIVTLASGALFVVDRARGAFHETTVAVVDAALARPEPPRVSVTTPGVSRRIAGLECTLHRLSADADALVLEAWVTPVLPRPPALVEALKVRYALMPTQGPRFAALLDGLGRLEGYPLGLVWRYSVLGLSLEVSSEATSIRREAIPPSLFVLPDGVTRRASPFLPAAVVAPASAAAPPLSETAPTQSPPPQPPTPVTPPAAHAPSQ